MMHSISPCRIFITARLWLHPLFPSLLRRIWGPIEIGLISFTRSFLVLSCFSLHLRPLRTQAQHGEAIRGIQEHLLGVPIQEELTALRFRADIAEAENASLRARIKTTEAIEKITRNHERQARVKIEQQLHLFAVSRVFRQSGAREDFRNSRSR
ncbi:hypothetical protein Tco_0926170 [Tanacetum coccineum]|uniref:Uncharacterized protein n=1 Tax=Tanacetum coccineum TaxID=301880 RepID=A0ABQ5D910_9ASTR